MMCEVQGDQFSTDATSWSSSNYVYTIVSGPETRLRVEGTLVICGESLFPRIAPLNMGSSMIVTEFSRASYGRWSSRWSRGDVIESSSRRGLKRNAERRGPELVRVRSMLKYLSRPYI